MPINARAVVLSEQGQSLTVETISVNDPGPGEVRVKMAAAGVCHSDLSLSTGKLAAKTPVVLGHEGAGVVESIGAGVTEVAVGDLVLLNWAPGCRDCWFCDNGEPQHCAAAAAVGGTTFATRADGTELYAGLGTATFSEMSVVAENAVVKLPADTDLGSAAVIGCAMMTGIGAVRHTADVQKGQSVAVIGLGGVGLSAIQGARLVGANPIIAIDTSPAKEDLARSMGATHFLLSGPTTSKDVRKLTDGRGVDHAFEVVGIAPTIRQAYSISRRGGNVTVVGVGAKTDEVTFNALELFYFGRTIRGSVFGGSDPKVDAPELLNLAADGDIDPHVLITDEIGIDDVPAAFERMKDGIGGRSLIRYS